LDPTSASSQRSIRQLVSL